MGKPTDGDDDDIHEQLKGAGVDDDDTRQKVADIIARRDKLNAAKEQSYREFTARRDAMAKASAAKNTSPGGALYQPQMTAQYTARRMPQAMTQPGGPKSAADWQQEANFWNQQVNDGMGRWDASINNFGQAVNGMVDQADRMSVMNSPNPTQAAIQAVSQRLAQQSQAQTAQVAAGLTAKFGVPPQVAAQVTTQLLGPLAQPVAVSPQGRKTDAASQPDSGGGRQLGMPQAYGPDAMTQALISRLVGGQ